jgi:hypothetical protein
MQCRRLVGLNGDGAAVAVGYNDDGQYNIIGFLHFLTVTDFDTPFTLSDCKISTIAVSWSNAITRGDNVSIMEQHRQVEL